MKKIKNSTALYLGLFLGAIIKFDLWAWREYLKYQSVEHSESCDFLRSPSYGCENPMVHTEECQGFLICIGVFLTLVLGVIVLVEVVGVIDSYISKAID